MSSGKGNSPRGSTYKCKGKYTIYNGQTNQVSRKVVRRQPERHKQHQQNQEPTTRWFEADRQDSATWQV